MSLKFKLTFLFTTIALVPAFFIGLVTFSNMERLIRQEIAKEHRLRVDDRSKEIVKLIANYRRQALVLRDLPPIQGILRSRETGSDPLDRSTLSDWQRRLEAIARRMIELSKDTRSISYVGTDGREFVRVEREGGEIRFSGAGGLESASSRHLFETDLLKKDEVYVSSVVLEPRKGPGVPAFEPVLWFATPVFDSEGGLSGAVSIRVAAGFLKELMRTTTLGQLLLIDQDGYVILDSGAEEAFEDPAAAERNYFKEQSELTHNLTLSEARIHYDPKDEEYRVWRKVFYRKNHPEKYWILLSVVKEAELFLPINRLKTYSFVIGAVAILIVLVVVLAVVRTITQPIEVLQKGVAVIGAGNFNHKVGTYEKDEIGRLSRDFDRMVVNLKKVMASRDELDREIKARELIQQELIKNQEELKRSNKDLESFAYVASHDLQEPLRMVASYTQLLSRRYKGKLDKDADEFIGYASDGALRMQQLIQDWLSYSRVSTQGKELKPVDLNPLLEEALQNLSVAIKESGAKIKKEALPTAKADEVQICQVFQNLVGNAIKYRGKRTPEIFVSAASKNGEVVISVKDNGIGIDPAYKEKIFHIFQRLHNREHYPGSGIGLSVCKKIVERHGGRIWVESRPGEGAVFYFTLRV